jgi:hypothetical protein
MQAVLLLTSHNRLLVAFRSVLCCAGLQVGHLAMWAQEYLANAETQGWLHDWEQRGQVCMTQEPMKHASLCCMGWHESM